MTRKKPEGAAPKPDGIVQIASVSVGCYTRIYALDRTGEIWVTAEFSDPPDTMAWRRVLRPDTIRARGV